jgi:hypothetical protein
MTTKKKKSVWTSFKENMPKHVDNLFFLKEDDGGDSSYGPSWKFRRKLIYGAYRLSFAMIIFGAITYVSDTSVGSGLVAGGVSLLGIILTAYTAASTYQDVKLWKPNDENPME